MLLGSLLSQELCLALFAHHCCIEPVKADLGIRSITTKEVDQRRQTVIVVEEQIVFCTFVERQDVEFALHEHPTARLQRVDFGDIGKLGEITSSILEEAGLAEMISKCYPAMSLKVCFRRFVCPGCDAVAGIWMFTRTISLTYLLLVLALGGCASTGSADNPSASQFNPPVENPLFVPQGQDPQQYQRVYDTVYDVCQRFFDIAGSNMYAGEIAGVPRISTGVFDWFRLEWYDGYELWESTAQSIRRRLQVQITPAEVGGYFILVRVYKELEDPGSGTIAGLSTTMRQDDLRTGSVKRVVPTSNWIDMGRDTRLESHILSKLKEKL